MAAPALLTNHGSVLMCVARENKMTIREIAGCVGITERAAHRIVCELCEAGYVSKRRVGARNQYAVHEQRELSDPMLKDRTIGELLDPLLKLGG